MKMTEIGGQGIIEGIAFRNGSENTVAVRGSKGNIILDRKTIRGDKERGVYKIPFLRGIVSFFSLLVSGGKNLWYSASVTDEKEEESEDEKVVVKEIERTDKDLEEETEKAIRNTKEKLVMGFLLVVSFVVAAALFMMLPYFLSTYFEKYITSQTVYTMLESGIRFIIFIALVFVVSRISTIKRILMYQGAANKVMNSILTGGELERKAVKKQKRKYKGSDSSFLLYVFLFSIILFMFVPIDNSGLRVAIRLLIIPGVAGVLYELSCFVKKSDSFLAKFFNVFRMWMQGFAVMEPDDEMIVFAIRVCEKVFAEQMEENKNTQPEKKEDVQKEENEEAREQPETEDKKEPEEDETEASNVISFMEARKEHTVHKVVKEGTRGKAGSKVSMRLDPGEEELRKDARWREQMKEFDGEEDDEILNALDHFFDE